MTTAKKGKKHYTDIQIADWNTSHFIAFMSDYHKARLGVTYMPLGGFQADAGTMGTLIGTKTKPAQYDKEIVYEWIRRCIDTYAPTAQYPGINLRFMYTYRMNIMQQLEREFQRRDHAAENDAQDLTEMEGWL